MRFPYFANEEELQVLQDRKDKLVKDLKERPMTVLTHSDLLCYTHNDTDPIISAIKIRYNGNDYIFHISHIDIEESKNDRSNR